MDGSGLGMTLWLVSMSFFIVSALLGGLNYIITIINMRTKGMKMTRLPLTIWAFFVTAILGVLSFPVLFSARFCSSSIEVGTSFYLSDIYIGGEAHTNGRKPDSIRTLVLVPRSPGSLHYHSSCIRYYFRNYFS